MITINSKTTMVGIVTLIVGLALGLGIGAWSVKNSQASNAPAPRINSGKHELTVSKSDEWDPFRQTERMQEEIDRAIRNATEQFQLGPNTAMFRPDLGYSSSFDLRDRKDHFELRAYLPDAKPSDVNVKIDNDRTLHVSVTQRKQETKNTSGGNATVAELGQYEQVVILPAPVKSSDMKVERKGHEVVITIPKAKNT